MLFKGTVSLTKACDPFSTVYASLDLAGQLGPDTVFVGHVTSCT